ncbi:hypothetical protein [Puia sp.]|jgi:hypothetical protein|uniref:hypothetical protein n=1 Tax=Puia sp. TaxID=2045100 RepID=UPI002F3FC33C
MRLIIALIAIAALASCHATKKVTQTVTKQVDSTTTIATHVQQDSVSIARLIQGKDVHITIKYFDRQQLQSFADSFVKTTKHSIEQKQTTHSSSRGGVNDLLPDQSRIAEITIDAASITDSAVAVRTAKTNDTTQKKKVVTTVKNQIVVETQTAWWDLPVKIGCGLILLIIIVLVIYKKFFNVKKVILLALPILLLASCRSNDSKILSTRYDSVGFHTVFDHTQIGEILHPGDTVWAHNVATVDTVYHVQANTAEQWHYAWAHGDVWWLVIGLFIIAAGLVWYIKKNNPGAKEWTVVVLIAAISVGGGIIGTSLGWWDGYSSDIKKPVYDGYMSKDGNLNAYFYNLLQ